MGDSCADLLFFSFNSTMVFLLTVKYLLVTIALLTTIYGILSLFTSSQKILFAKTDTRLIIVLVLALIINFIVFSQIVVSTMFATTYQFAEATPNIFDTSKISSKDTIVSEINSACDINLKTIDHVISVTLASFSAIQVMLTVIIYAMRLLIEFKDTALAVTRSNRQVLVVLMGLFIVVIVALLVLMVFDRDIAIFVGSFGYLLYLVSMAYVCRLYFKKLSLSSKVDFKDSIRNDAQTSTTIDAVTGVVVSPTGGMASSTGMVGGDELTVFADSTLVDKLTLYSVTLVVGYVSSIFGIIFTILFAVAGEGNEFVLEMMQGIFFTADGYFNLLAVLWQFGMANGVYRKCCKGVHSYVAVKWGNKVVSLEMETAK